MKSRSQRAFRHKCEPYHVEMIVRAYLTSSSWRSYKSSARSICGITDPGGYEGTSEIR
ncbi:MAG: phosphoribosylaminoimidazolesuccinocarboxamide synthase [Bacteroidales bacterium]